MSRQWTYRSRLALALGLASLTVAASVWAQQPPATAGQTPPAGGRGGNFGANFVGKVTVGTTTEMRMSRIRFEAGARTNWHLHSTAQLLLIEEGKGRLQEQGGPIVELEPGGPVYTKANVRHWHGAAPESHAVQFSVYTGELEWQTPVTDVEYAGKGQ